MWPSLEKPIYIPLLSSEQDFDDKRTNTTCSASKPIIKDKVVWVYISTTILCTMVNRVCECTNEMNHELPMIGYRTSFLRQPLNYNPYMHICQRFNEWY